MGVAFRELDDSPEYLISQKGMKAKRTILISTSDFGPMLREIYGSGLAIGNSTGCTFPGINNLLVTTVRANAWPKITDGTGEDFDDITTDLATYTDQLPPKRRFVKLEINYETLPISSFPDLSVQEGTRVTYRMDFGGEYMDLPGRSFTWEDKPAEVVPADIKPMLKIPTAEHHITWHNVISVPWKKIRAYRGCVNGEEWLGWEKETLLFEGANAEGELVGYDYNTGPVFAYQVHYLFRERTITDGSATGDPDDDNIDNEHMFGWLHAYRTRPHDDAGWDRLLDTKQYQDNPETAGGPYPVVAGFNPLFFYES